MYKFDRIGDRTVVTFTPRNYWSVLTIVFSCAIGVFFGFIPLLAAWSLFSLLMLLYGIKSPRAALYGLLILVVLDPLTRIFLLNSSVFPLLRWNTFNYVLIGYAFLYLPLVLRLKNPQVVLFLVLLAIFWAFLVVATHLVRGITQTFLPSAYLGIIVICARVDLGDTSWQQLGIIASSLGLIIGTLFQVQQLTVYADHNALIHVNVGAAVVALACYILASKNQQATMIHIILLVANSLISLLAGSRGGIIICGLIIFSLFLFMIYFKQGSGMMLSFMLIIVLIFALISLFPTQYNTTLNRLRKTIDSNTYTLTQRTSSRSDLALGAWQIFLKNPLGVGTGNFPREWALMGTLNGPLSVAPAAEKAAHGAWFLVLAENGIIGFVILFLWITSFTYSGLHTHNGMTRLLGITITIVLATNFFHTGFQSKAIGFLFAFCTIVINHPQVLRSVAFKHSLNPIKK